jgi:mannose-6-phosphate isomerase-like protein (cupin superfamily)
VRVTTRAERQLAEVTPGVRRGIYVDAAEGARQLSLGAAELDPGKEVPVHRHRAGERYVEEGFYVLEGTGEVRVDDQARPIGPGSFCVMSPADGFHTIRNTGSTTLRFVMCYAGTAVQMERKP